MPNESVEPHKTLAQGRPRMSAGPAFTLTVLADDDMQTLMRVLSPFAVAGARAINLVVRPIGSGECLIELAVTGLNRGQEVLIAARVENVTTVRSTGHELCAAEDLPETSV